MRVSIYNPETFAIGSTLWLTISPGFIPLFINQGVGDSVIMHIVDFVSMLRYFYIFMHRFQPSYLNIWYLNKCKNINASLGLYTRLSWKRHYSEKLFYGNVTGGENRDSYPAPPAYDVSALIETRNIKWQSHSFWLRDRNIKPSFYIIDLLWQCYCKQTEKN